MVLSATPTLRRRRRCSSERLDDHTVLVASSDLSHYYPYETANRKDTACTTAICNLDIEAMQQQEACGKMPILVLMHIARQKHWKATLLKQCNSGDTATDKSRVVGYAAIAFCEAEYSHEDRKRLLELARSTIEKAVQGHDLPEPEAGDIPAEFAAAAGMFRDPDERAGNCGAASAAFFRRNRCTAA